jgi:hypothetical protein
VFEGILKIGHIGPFEPKSVRIVMYGHVSCVGVKIFSLEKTMKAQRGIRGVALL